MVSPADIAALNPEGRISGSRQRGTMDHIYELDPGPSEEPEDTSLDREETRRRRFGRCTSLDDLKEIIR